MGTLDCENHFQQYHNECPQQHCHFNDTVSGLYDTCWNCYQKDTEGSRIFLERNAASVIKFQEKYCTMHQQEVHQVADPILLCLECWK